MTIGDSRLVVVSFEDRILHAVIRDEEQLSKNSNVLSDRRSAPGKIGIASTDSVGDIGRDFIIGRAKSGDASVHPISARESRALRKLLREAPPSPYVFISERDAPLSAAGYQRMVARAGLAAKFKFLVHSHMLRHACGFKLANDGPDTRAIQAYLGTDRSCPRFATRP
jgi:Phage integrase family